MTDQHSVFGGSAAARWLNCPGSVQLIQQVPKIEKEDAYALEGSYAHFLAEIELASWREKNVWERKTQVPDNQPLKIPNPLNPNWRDTGRDMHPDEEMINAIDQYIQVVVGDMADIGAPPKVLQIEQKFTLANISEEAYGTCDASFVWHGVLFVYDFKYGVQPINAWENKQLQFYAVGAMVNLPEAERRQIQRVELCIVQPRSFIEDQTISRHTIGVPQLAAFNRTIRQAISDSHSESLVLCTGYWCETSYCPAKVFCPALLGEVKHVMNFIANDKAVAAIDSSPQKISQLLLAEDRVNSFYKSLKIVAKTLADQGTEIPDFKLVDERKNRVWSDEEKVEKFLAKHLPETPARRPGKLRPIGEVEKDLKKKKLGLPAELTTRPPGGVTLVHVSDARPAICTIEMPLIPLSLADLDI